MMSGDARKGGGVKWSKGIMRSTEIRALCEVRTRMTTQRTELGIMEQRFSSFARAINASSCSSFISTASGTAIRPPRQPDSHMIHKHRHRLSRFHLFHGFRRPLNSGCCLAACQSCSHRSLARTKGGRASLPPPRTAAGRPHRLVYS